MLLQIDPQEVLQRAFPGLPDSQAEELIVRSRMRTFEPSTVICQEGAHETTFYILLKGEVRVSKWINAREERVLKHLHAGDFFGEMAIIHNAPRSATIVAVQPCMALEMQKEEFASLLERSSSISLAMVREVSRRLRENDTMAIEDLRQKATELAAAYQQLAEQDFARRKFLTTIAHELRTPLMAATGFIQAIQSGMLQGENLEPALKTVARNLQDITSLTNDLLFLQEMDLILPEFKPMNFGDILPGLVEQQSAHARENGVVISLLVPPGLPDILADARSLARALAAILDNAIKFSPEGGDVLVESGYDENEVWVRITDHGVGIAPEVQLRIFDRFFHVDRIGDHLFRGLGLGLSIARQVVVQQRGYITVTGQPGQGSTFTVYLPRPKE